MTYKGYAANIKYYAEDRTFVGRLAGVTDIVTFHGESVTELEAEFQAAVDHYLAVSEKTEIPAQKPFTGELCLNIPPEVHAHAAMMAYNQRLGNPLPAKSTLGKPWAQRHPPSFNEEPYDT